MNFGQVIDSVQDWLNRDDLSPVVPTWIKMVQLQLERRHNFRYMESSKTWSDISSHALTSFPTDYKEMLHAQVVDSTGKRHPLIKAEESYAWSQYPNPSSDTGTPKLISVVEKATKAILRPTPNGTVTVIMPYYAYSSELMDLGDTNWLTLNAYDVLIYGALLEAEPYLSSRDLIDVWKDKYTTALASIALSERREKHMGSPQTVQPYGDVV